MKIDIKVLLVVLMFLVGLIGILLFLQQNGLQKTDKNFSNLNTNKDTSGRSVIYRDVLASEYNGIGTVFEGANGPSMLVARMVSYQQSGDNKEVWTLSESTTDLNSDQIDVVVDYTLGMNSVDSFWVEDLNSYATTGKQKIERIADNSSRLANLREIVHSLIKPGDMIGIVMAVDKLDDKGNVILKLDDSRVVVLRMVIRRYGGINQIEKELK